MTQHGRPPSRDQTAQEAIFGRVLFLWIAAYLILTCATLVLDHDKSLAITDTPTNHIGQEGIHVPIPYQISVRDGTVIGA